MSAPPSAAESGVRSLTSTPPTLEELFLRHYADETAEDIERWEEEWDEEGFGLFAVELLGSGELILAHVPAEEWLSVSLYPGHD
ncbi:hypothetical protein AB0D99_26885, partial [Streptomyces sp. NPDC047971]